MDSVRRQGNGPPPERGILPYGLVRGLLLAVGIFNAVSAIGGGIGLLTPGSLGLPLRLISAAGFTSYFWPGILLLAVIGGTQCIAVAAELRSAVTASFWAALAGFAMIIWIFVELAVMASYTTLHGIYFGTGILQLALVLALLGVLPGLVRGVSVRIS